MLDDAKKFLARAVPWPTKGEAWWINIHHTWLPPGARRAVLPGRAFKTLDDALAEIERLAKGEPTDIYVCMSAQSQTKPSLKIDNLAERSKEGALWFCGIWLDVDLKKSDGTVIFGSTAIALQALGAFCQRTGLPFPSFIVYSGSGGFHAHWLFDQPVSHETWEPLAYALRDACLATGFTVDGKNTVDAARVLRIPDTHNWKGGIGHPVTLAHEGIAHPLQILRSSLGPFFSPLGTIPARMGGNTTPTRNFVWQSTVPNRRPKKLATRWTTIGDAGKLPLLDILQGGCKWIRRVAITEGKDEPEPLWREALALAYYTVEGRNAIHQFSRAHPGYDWGDTEDKYDRIEKDRDGGLYGWPQCNTIYGAGAAECPSCPLRAEGRSPINFAKVDDPPTALTVAGKAPPLPPIQMPGRDLPDGWNRTDDGLVYTMERDKEADDPAAPQVRKYAANLPIWNLRGQRPTDKDSKEGRYVCFTTELNIDERIEVVVPVSATSDQRTLMAATTAQGFVIPKECRNYFEKLMTSFIERLRTQSVQVSENFGWSSEGGVENAFVYNKTRWNCSGDTPVAQSNPGIANLYLPTGSMEPWLKAASLVFDRQRPDLEAIMSAAFAAPLVVLTGHAGLVISAYSNKSGVGKTTSLKVGAATWGHPTNSMAGIETGNYLNKQLALLRHLPLFYDEARTARDQTTKMAELLMTIGLGRVKGRLNRGANIVPVESYNTILMAASNNSLFDYIGEHTPTTVAGIMRIFEFEAERSDIGPLIDVGDAQMLVGALDKNYGWAGLEYAKFLGRNADHVRQEIREYNAKFTSHFHATNEERFWLAAMVTMRVGAKLANAVGITKFDERKLIEFLGQEFERMRKLRSTSSTDIGRGDTLRDYLANYLNDRQANTLVTDVMPKRGRGQVQIISNDRMLRLPIRVHVANDEKLMRISTKDFRAWLKLQEVTEVRAIYDRMTQPNSVALASRATLGHDRTKGSPEYVLEIDLSKYPDLRE